MFPSPKRIDYSNILSYFLSVFQKIHLFTNYKGWEKIARRFVRAKIKVILEYEEGECNE